MSRLRKIGPESLAMSLLVVLVGLSAFGLGRISVIGEGAAPSVPVPHVLVGSKTGSVYYMPNCKGAETIAEQNKVWFGTRADAEAAGYRPAANCAGL